MSNEQISQSIRTQELNRQNKRYRVQISKKDMKTILNIFSFHGNANLSLHLDSIFFPVRTAIIKNIKDNKYWKGCILKWITLMEF